MKVAWTSLAAACALVVGVYACTARLNALESLIPSAADNPYNLLVRGFRAGQLSLKKEVPPGLAHLADPYDPAASSPYWSFPSRLLDLSYYKGHLYMYFGVTPALILFWPYVALTGHYLSNRHAVTIFCALGILLSLGLLRALWRRYFTEVSAWVVAVCALALGLATGVPSMLPRSQVHEVASSCGYMLTMLALAAIWCALHEPQRRCRWLAAASVAYGLAVGARPNLLLGAVILLVPVAQTWRVRRQLWAALLAAIGPILLIGLGLMLYNARRFDNPFEFGMHYQLNEDRLHVRQLSSLRYLWFNFRLYFLQPARWSAPFPFVHEIAVPPVPPGYGKASDPFGILTNIPFAWLALLAPLAWRGRSEEARSTLRWFVTAAALLFGTCAFTIGTYFVASMRYEVDFLPALLLLAVAGILGLERALPDRPAWRRGARYGWGLLLGFSVVFNVLLGVARYGYEGCALGSVLAYEGRLPEAIQLFGEALRIKPDFAEGHNDLAVTLIQLGRVPEAMGQWEQALRIQPDYAEVHNNLAVTLVQLGRVQEATEHWERALRSNPNYAEAHNNLAFALWQKGRVEEAVEHYEQALRVKPDMAEAHYNLAMLLVQMGKLREAVTEFKQVLRIKPDYLEAHCNLGIVLVRQGRVPEAIEHFREVLRIKPDFPEAENGWGMALTRQGNLPEAIEHLEQALRIKPGFAEAHYNLGAALEQAGKLPDATGHYEQALRINPDYADARNALARLHAGQ